MLAQNFKTAADLGISDVELDALIKVLGMLERGEIVLIPTRDLAQGLRASESDPTHFNMGFVHAGFDCGTAACMLGWARSVEPSSFRGSIVDRPQPLLALFLMGEQSTLQDSRAIVNNPDDITPSQAAIALRSYITTGEANWAEALNV